MRHLLLLIMLVVLCAAALHPPADGSARIDRAGHVGIDLAGLSSVIGPEHVGIEHVGIEHVPAEHVELEDTVELSAASPNPFSYRTAFSLRVEQGQHVEVSVYNVLGQQVQLLHDGWLAPGMEYTFAFRAESLPSGIYLYRARGETFVATRRVTLVG